MSHERRVRRKNGNVWLVLLTYHEGETHVEAVRSLKEAKSMLLDAADWGTAVKLVEIKDLQWPEELTE